MKATAASGQAIKTIIASGHSVRMGNEDDGSVRTVMKMTAASRHSIRTGNEDNGCVTTLCQDA
jgi:hypothetical protein